MPYAAGNGSTLMQRDSRFGDILQMEAPRRGHLSEVPVWNYVVPRSRSRENTLLRVDEN